MSVCWLLDLPMVSVAGMRRVLQTLSHSTAVPLLPVDTTMIMLMITTMLMTTAQSPLPPQSVMPARELERVT